MATFLADGTNEANDDAAPDDDEEGGGGIGQKEDTFEAGLAAEAHPVDGGGKDNHGQRERTAPEDGLFGFKRPAQHGDDEDNDFVLKSSPCPFLLADNRCSVYDHRPRACREYPHTDRRKMVQILELTHRNTLVCPAVLEILAKVSAASGLK